MLMRLISLGLMLGSASVFASYPEAMTTRDFCDLEVRLGEYGNGQPQSLPVHHRGPAKQGRVFTGSEGQYMCWRRENNPGVCTSGFSPSYNCVKGWMGIEDGQPAKETIN